MTRALPFGAVLLEPFGLLVIATVAVGVIVAHHRARKLGLDEWLLSQVALVAVFSGFAFSHVVYAGGYAPEQLAHDPLYISKIW